MACLNGRDVGEQVRKAQTNVHLFWADVHGQQVRHFGWLWAEKEKAMVLWKQQPAQPAKGRLEEQCLRMGRDAHGGEAEGPIRLQRGRARLLADKRERESTELKGAREWHGQQQVVAQRTGTGGAGVR